MGTPYDTGTKLWTPWFFFHLLLVKLIFKLESIMHYPSYNEFALDQSKPTITKKDGGIIGTNSDFSKVSFLLLKIWSRLTKAVPDF